MVKKCQGYTKSGGRVDRRFQCYILNIIMNFWEKLHKPFFALAPLEDVTDAAFRRLIAKYGKPDVMFTEFTAADGLLLADERGKQKLLKKLLFSESERPIVAQLFTSVPEHMEKAAALVEEMGFDGLDINMGCPNRAIEKQGCGAAMIKNHPLAREIIQAAKRGAPNLPISIKTRVGYKSDDELEDWVRTLLGEDIATITIHARTRNDMSKVPARWKLVKRAVEIRDEMSVDTLILGNGDVKDVKDAKDKVKETGCDGVMLGRAIYGNPWLFSDRKDEPTKNEKILALVEHLKLFDELLGDTSNYAVITDDKSSDIASSLGRDESKLSSCSSFATMKKHFKAYINDWDGAKELRIKLMETSSISEAVKILQYE
jgi:nifR3 family TIM-barrel protein